MKIFKYILCSVVFLGGLTVFFISSGSVTNMDVERVADITLPSNAVVLRDESDATLGSQSSSVYYTLQFSDSASAESMVTSILQSKYYLSELACTEKIRIALEQGCKGLPMHFVCENSPENTCQDYLIFDDTAWVETEYGYYFQHNEVSGRAIIGYYIEYNMNTRELAYKRSYAQ